MVSPYFLNILSLLKMTFVVEFHKHFFTEQMME